MILVSEKNSNKIKYNNTINIILIHKNYSDNKKLLYKMLQSMIHL